MLKVSNLLKIVGRRMLDSGCPTVAHNERVLKLNGKEPNPMQANQVSAVWIQYSVVRCLFKLLNFVK